MRRFSHDAEEIHNSLQLIRTFFQQDVWLKIVRKAGSMITVMESKSSVLFYKMQKTKVNAKPVACF